MTRRGSSDSDLTPFEQALTKAIEGELSEVLRLYTSARKRGVAVLPALRAALPEELAAHFFSPPPRRPQPPKKPKRFAELDRLTMLKRRLDERIWARKP